MLDTFGYLLNRTEISRTVLVIQRGEFTHKTYYFRSFILGQTFDEILKLLDQINVTINKII